MPSRRTKGATRRHLTFGTLSLMLLTTAVSAAPVDSSLVEGAVDYRCDQLRLSQKNSRQARCEGNVIIRRGPWWLCCDRAIGEADAAWQWQAVRCRGHIRVRHGEETMWADAADFDAKSGTLTLSGAPVLQRGQSVMRGRRILVDTHSQGARIEAPEGSLSIAELKAASHSVIPVDADLGPLPQRCPLPIERP